MKVHVEELAFTAVAGEDGANSILSTIRTSRPDSPNDIDKENTEGQAYLKSENHATFRKTLP